MPQNETNGVQQSQNKQQENPAAKKVMANQPNRMAKPSDERSDQPDLNITARVELEGMKPPIANCIV